MSIRKNNEIKVSFIVPFYNGEKYANECVHSILDQDYSNIEVILVDDESTDGTLSVLKKLASEDKRVRVVQRKNGGVSAARNTALDLATGDYICLVDQDDKIDPDYNQIVGLLNDPKYSHISRMPNNK